LPVFLLLAGLVLALLLMLPPSAPVLVLLSDLVTLGL
jgi:hypothetical protein